MISDFHSPNLGKEQCLFFSYGGLLHIPSALSVSFTPLFFLYMETNCALKTIFHHLTLGSKQSEFLGTPPICIS